MACALQARRTLLWSIIRAPTLSRPDLSRVLPVQTRHLHATQPQHNNGFSITFGTEIDGLLEKQKSPKSAHGKLKSTVKQRTTKKSAKLPPVKLNLSTPTTPGESGSQNQAEDEGYNALLDSESIATQNLIHDSQKQIHPHDADTLELSENAYDEISKPGSMLGRSSKPRKSSKAQVDNVGQMSKRGTPPARPSKKLESWQIQKEALQKKFGEEGWKPRKKLSPDAIEGIRALHEQDPERYSTVILSQQFKISPEAIRRILKSKWKPSPEVMEDRRARWARRHDRIWDHKEALGQRPPRRGDRDPEGPEAFEEEVRAKQMLGQL